MWTEQELDKYGLASLTFIIGIALSVIRSMCFCHNHMDKLDKEFFLSLLLGLGTTYLQEYQTVYIICMMSVYMIFVALFKLINKIQINERRYIPNVKKD